VSDYRRKRKREKRGNALGGLSGSSLSTEDDKLTLAEHLEELGHLLVNGELLAQLEDVEVALRVGEEGERVRLAGLRRERISTVLDGGSGTQAREAATRKSPLPPPDLLPLPPVRERELDAP
jgi:hypothetical protein